VNKLSLSAAQLSTLPQKYWIKKVMVTQLTGGLLEFWFMKWQLEDHHLCIKTITN
jgi:hypothetical protein